MNHKRKRILVLGHATHGKDTTAELINQKYGLKFTSSSIRASEIFLFEALREKYGYKDPGECFKDRVNHRAEWHDLICEYNKEDKARLAKDILRTTDMYVGMRSNEEYEECIMQGLFDLVLGVYDPRKPLEDESSFNIDIWTASDIIIPNAGNIMDLSARLDLLKPIIT